MRTLCGRRARRVGQRRGLTCFVRAVQPDYSMPVRIPIAWCGPVDCACRRSDGLSTQRTYHRWIWDGGLFFSFRKAKGRGSKLLAGDFLWQSLPFLTAYNIA